MCTCIAWYIAYIITDENLLSILGLTDRFDNHTQIFLDKIFHSHVINGPSMHHIREKVI